MSAASGSDNFDLSQFHGVFFDEAAEHLEGMEALLLDIDPASADEAQLNAIFRAAHSIKGGATAMLEMERAGAVNLAQDEASCVVFGMPKEAIACGGVDEVLPLSAIADRLLALLRAGGMLRHRI